MKSPSSTVANSFEPEIEPELPHVYSQGPNTLSINKTAFHNSTRRRALALLSQRGINKGLILLKGGTAWRVYDTDMDEVFRQESYFHYLFGVEEDGYYGALDVETGKCTLFMPRFPDSYSIWLGPLQGAEAKRLKYGVDAVHYVEEFQEWCKVQKPSIILLLEGCNSDSQHKLPPVTFGDLDLYQLDRTSLHDILAESRSIKTPEELEVIEYVCSVASTAHIEVMRKCRPGLMEYAMESIFRNCCYLQGGCRRLPYTPICACGANAAILHYGHAGAPNSRQIGNDDVMLLDMGCEYYCYGSDITSTFPADGQFTSKQRLVYESVLSAHTAVLKAMRPGVSWTDMHLLAEREILLGLKAGGMVKGDVAEMLDFRIGALFMPHGLGHLLGLDTHDVGGYISGRFPERSDLPGLKCLRTARMLEEGMVITVEPGCYFIPSLLEPAFENPAQTKFLHKSVLQGYMNFGGVRIEDDVLVTASGCRSLSDVPRSVEDIEQVMAGKSWP